MFCLHWWRCRRFSESSKRCVCLCATERVSVVRGSFELMNETSLMSWHCWNWFLKRSFDLWRARTWNETKMTLRMATGLRSIDFHREHLNVISLCAFAVWFVVAAFGVFPSFPLFVLYLKNQQFPRSKLSVSTLVYFSIPNKRPTNCRYGVNLDNWLNEIGYSQTELCESSSCL